LSALLAGRFLPPRKILVLISIRGSFDTRAIVRLEGLGKLKSPPHLGLEPASSGSVLIGDVIYLHIIRFWYLLNVLIMVN
jgi:hypothetical protein